MEGVHQGSWLSKKPPSQEPLRATCQEAPTKELPVVEGPKRRIQGDFLIETSTRFLHYLSAILSCPGMAGMAPRGSGANWEATLSPPGRGDEWCPTASPSAAGIQRKPRHPGSDRGSFEQNNNHRNRLSGFKWRIAAEGQGRQGRLPVVAFWKELGRECMLTGKPVGLPPRPIDLP